MRKNKSSVKNTFIICKQLNGPVLKSLKPSCLYRNRKKIGRARAKILYFVSGRAGLGPKFQFPFRARPGRARTEISISLSGRSGPGPKFFSLLQAGPGPVWKIRPVHTSIFNKNNKKMKNGTLVQNNFSFFAVG